MKVSFSWLKDYLETDFSFEEFRSKITRLGFGVDAVEKTGVDVEKVFTAEILKIEKHPNADRLSLCEVSTGEKIYKVVCGAKNIEVGQKVPFAVVGARLPEGELKKAKIRGVESEGMICSAQELGLSGYNSDGILLLDKKLALGLDIKKVFPKGDYVFELEITPNLAYCLSHYALARELSVFYGYKLKEIEIPCVFSSGRDELEIELENPEDCGRYVGIIIKGVTEKKTPEWMSERLKFAGLNPKGDILIDATNYVMFEMGQPTHCFDLRNLKGGKIKVRRAEKGEKIKTLDGCEQELSAEITVIADAEKPVAVAGVMGGFFSSVSLDTAEVLVESAFFNPSSVRKSSRLLNIKSDSSFRFERGVDPELQLKAAFRIAGLIKNINPQAQITQITDNHPLKKDPVRVEIDHDRINAILGSSLERKKIDGCLKAISPSYDGLVFKAPSYRQDLKTIWDIAEEVARYIGYDLIESKTSMPVMKALENPSSVLALELSRKFSDLGFSEVCNYDLISLKEIKDCLLDPENAPELKNPLSADFHHLRPSLLPGLIKNLRYNLNRGAETVMIYEIGQVFSVKQEKPSEKNMLCGLVCGKEPEFWRGEKKTLDFYRLKGLLENILSSFPGFYFVKKTAGSPAFFSEETINLSAAGSAVGSMGLISGPVLVNYGLNDREVCYFEIELDVLEKHFETEFYKSAGKIKPVSQFQRSWRDLSVLVDRKYSWDEIYREMKRLPDLLWVKLVDVYEGKNIPENSKSLTLRFMFSSMEKTFTDEELNKIMETALKKLQEKFQAVLRS